MVGTRAQSGRGHRSTTRPDVDPRLSMSGTSWRQIRSSRTSPPRGGTLRAGVLVLHKVVFTIVSLDVRRWRWQTEWR